MASKVKYEINLVDVFDRAYSGRSEKLKSSLRPLLKRSSVLQKFGEEVIFAIDERTGKGKDKNNKVFRNNEGKTGYSKAYKESLKFKIYKAGQTTVNLKLTGNMRASMKNRWNTSERKVTIFFPDNLQNNKAHGHINGSKILPKRDFFGLPKKDEEKILKDILDGIGAGDELATLSAEIIAGAISRNIRASNETVTSTSNQSLSDAEIDEIMSQL